MLVDYPMIGVWGLAGGGVSSPQCASVVGFKKHPPRFYEKGETNVRQGNDFIFAIQMQGSK